MGNHVWDQREIMNFIDREPRLVRPANYPVGAPGQGYGFIRAKGKKIGVLISQGVSSYRHWMILLVEPSAVLIRSNKRLLLLLLISMLRQLRKKSP